VEAERKAGLDATRASGAEVSLADTSISTGSEQHAKYERNVDSKL